ncbi:hypothetical protein ACFQ3R_13065 [Mesonia ostreae]|uniref:Uncharacterized protein n=1 Tax=Mesonia ostreae TaxID=861110 RepID=A0ABU2KFN2_9FLAO|nr:hypothetical protein [Mesonia ostreae]MDT0293516.1 hypothetical protein [Mesonia ostreae]
MKTNYLFEVGFKAELTLKLEMGMEFDRFPIFLGNQRTSGMEIGSFGVVSKTFLMKRFSRNVAFGGMQGEWAELDNDIHYLISTTIYLYVKI